MLMLAVGVLAVAGIARKGNSRSLKAVLALGQIMLLGLVAAALAAQCIANALAGLMPKREWHGVHGWATARAAPAAVCAHFAHQR